MPSGGNTNVYGASPFPRSTLGYAASTANDISADAFAHLERVVAGWPAAGLDAAAYRDALEQCRARLRKAWSVDSAVDVVFAPSGTDLEYVALALAAARSRPVTNILLGQDEIGSGCGLAATGRYFAGETALVASVAKGAPVAGMDAELVNIPVRDGQGQAADSAAVAQAIAAAVERAASAGRHALVHVVHGSKTGLVLPEMADIDALCARFGDGLSLVVDACQARVEPAQVRAYLDRGAIVLLTGSKFIGGPPFSGFALVPVRPCSSARLAPGFATVFRRAEWPAGWAGCDHLPATANPGLLLRIEAALFELERYRLLEPADRARVVAHFGHAVRGLAARLGVGLVAPALADQSIHRGTLATLDLSALPGCPDLAVAQRWCRVLAARGLRLGQPVKCVRRTIGDDSGEWAGTLRLSLSMPLIVELAALDGPALATRFGRDMARIADVLEAAQRPIVA